MPNTLGTTPSFYNFIPLSTPSSRRSGRCRFRTDYGTEAGLPGPPRDSPAVGLSRRARRSNEFRWRERDSTEPRCSPGPAPASTADALAVTVRETTHMAYAGAFRLERPTRAATPFSTPSYRNFDHLVCGLTRRLGRPLAGVRSVAPCERSLSVSIGCTQAPVVSMQSPWSLGRCGMSKNSGENTDWRVHQTDAPSVLLRLQHCFNETGGGPSPFDLRVGELPRFGVGDDERSIERSIAV